MERYNFKKIEKKWQDFWIKNKSFKSKIDNKLKKSFIVLKCFLIHLEKFTWAMLEITL